MNYSIIFRAVNIVVAAFMIIGGVMTCFAGGNNKKRKKGDGIKLNTQYNRFSKLHSGYFCCVIKSNKGAQHGLFIVT